MRKKKLFPLELQFFAEGDDNNSGSDEKKNEENNQNKSDEKMFTQEQVNNMMAKEKHEGKRSVLSALGFKTEEEAKSAVSLYNALVNSQKSEEEKHKSELDKANEEKTESLKRAEAAENKLACFEAGVNKDSIDDVMAIAVTKITENKDLGKVLSEMKKDNKYAAFFETEKGSDGTGHNPGHMGSGSFGKAGDYGKNLGAAFAKKDEQKKSSYF